MTKKKKIIFISDLISNGGVETHLYNLCENLSSTENEINIYILAKYINPNNHFFKSKIRNVEFCYYTLKDQKLSHSKLSNFVFFCLAWKLAFSKVDLIYSMYLSPLVTLCNIIFLKKNGKLVYNIVGDPKSLNQQFNEKLRKYTSGHIVTDVICETILHARLIQNNDLNLHVIPHISNAKAIEGFSKAKSQNFRVAFLGRMDSHKGADLLFDIFKTMSNNRISLTYYASEGDIRETLVKEVLHDKELIHKVNFKPGWSNFNELAQIHQEVDLVVLLSKGEGLPLTLIECLAFGTPFFAINTGAIELLNCPPITKLVDKDSLSIQEELEKHVAFLAENKPDTVSLKDKFIQNFDKAYLFEMYRKVMMI